ncbi:MAG: OsmC family protein [Chlorobiaceae bacterium]|nr:OsmC family protein [Chlorobiaceae bacterium]
MHTSVRFNGKLPLVGQNDKGQKTRFDASMDFSGPARYASPMEVVLESFAACSMMDIIAILKKMRKELINLEADLEAERADGHPKVFTSIHVRYRLKSPDCSLEEFNKAITLSIDKYCSVAAMLRGSGCSITWDSGLGRA